MQEDQAVGCYQQGIDLARRIGDTSSEVNCMVNMVVACGALGQLDKANEVGEQALALCRSTNQKELEMACLTNLVAAHKHAHQDGTWDHEKAIQMLERAVELAKEASDKAGEGKAYHGLAGVHSAMQNFRKANEFLEKDLAICTALGDTSGAGEQV